MQENDYTLMAWVNMDMINDGRILDKATAGAIDGYEFDIFRRGEGILLLTKRLDHNVLPRQGCGALVCGRELLCGEKKAQQRNMVSRCRFVLISRRRHKTLREWQNRCCGDAQYFHSHQ